MFTPKFASATTSPEKKTSQFPRVSSENLAPSQEPSTSRFNCFIEENLMESLNELKELARQKRALILVKKIKDRNCEQAWATRYHLSEQERKEERETNLADKEKSDAKREIDAADEEIKTVTQYIETLTLAADATYMPPEAIPFLQALNQVKTGYEKGAGAPSAR